MSEQDQQYTETEGEVPEGFDIDPSGYGGDDASAIDWGATAAHIPNTTTEEDTTTSGDDDEEDVVVQPRMVTNNVTVNNPQQATLAVKVGSAQLTIEDDGAVMFANRIVGEFDGASLTINAGWARIAGLGIKIEGDTTDRRRVVFERGVLDHRLASGS